MEYRRRSTSGFPKGLRNGHSSFNGRGIFNGLFDYRRDSGRVVVQDYGEIFGGAGASIPVLDVPEVNESEMLVDVLSSKLNYSNIFGGSAEFDFAASHEQLLSKPKMEKMTPVAKTRSHSESSFPSNFPVANEVASLEASHQSFGDIKKFKMSCKKSSPGTKNGTNGTMHAAQLHGGPAGYTFLVDEIIPLPTTQDDKPVSSATHDGCPTINFSDGMMEFRHHGRTMLDLPPDGGASKLSSERDHAIQGKSSGSEYHQTDIFFDANDVGLGKQPSRVSPASSLPNNTGSKKCHSSKSGASMTHISGDATAVSSPPYFDEEIDVNSVAATSAAAVKRAIEEAQARIKMAKKLKERKKVRHQNFVKPKFDGLTGNERKEVKDTVKEKKFGEQETSVQTFSSIRKPNAIEPVQMVPDLGDRENAFVGNEAAGEAHGENFRSFMANQRQEEIEESKSGKKGEKVKYIMQSMNECQPEKNKADENQEDDVKKVEAIEETSTDVVEEEQDALTAACDLQESRNKQKSAEEVPDQKQDRNKLIFSQIWVKIEEMLGVSTELEASESKLNKLEKLTDNKQILEREEPKEDNSLNRSEDAQQCAPETEESQTVLQDIPMKEECGVRFEEASEMVELEEEQKEFCGVEDNDEKHDLCSEYAEKLIDKFEKMEIFEQKLDDFYYVEENENKFKEGDESGGNQEETVSVVKEVNEIKETEETQKGTSEWENTERVPEQTDQRVEGERMEETEKAYEIETEDRKKGTTELENTQMIQELTGGIIDGEKPESTEEDLMSHSDVGEAEDTYKQVEIKNLIETQQHFEEVVTTLEVFARADNFGIEELTEACLQFKETGRESEALEVDNDVEHTRVFDASGLADGISELDEIKRQAENAREAPALDKNGMNVGMMDMKFEEFQHDQHAKGSEIFCNVGTDVDLACELEKSNKDFEEDGAAVQQENKYGSESTDGILWPDNGESIEAADQPPCTFEGKEETVGIAHETETNQSTEQDDKNHCKTLTEMEMDLEKDEQRKRDEAKEGEKERVAVERAVLEACDRAFAEAQERAERAERAAAERANAEAHQKAMPEARQKWEKPSSKVNDKASMEAKLKAERAAVERAIAEARQRALEKAMSEKSAFQARNQAEKFSAERLSGSSKYNGTKHTVRPYDSHSNGSNTSTSSRYPNSSSNGVIHTSERFEGANGEPAQRHKARLERHQRTAERAAKALAEKNMRDLIAQNEQAERNRLADTLDAEIKRWSKGKEGNLRALLSTLQYVLGPESGWKPVPLTDLIATAAVKKAYRKATLFVHPDKLQQRGASIQQKYTCEKVFDLLKAAWNKFSAEER
ncbi:hypothetical protein SLEP1_g9 [Rubroshorea leprosula]|uniref:Auxilin-like protein 1 n=1 Tax=Rubroshorea leprosula TaxID=152421 RepID=A0AAV5HJM1_9ROSI|nr:hypothetical protein SLEP1_g9 [Rubroshorea leprosula]